MDYQSTLRNLKPRHEFFIGIDSDGCVFDTMEVKQKEFFIPNAIQYFQLHDIAGEVKETWEFVNLYSVYRGGNRFTSIIKVFELLSDREEIKSKGFKLPDLSTLKEWIRIESKLSNENLRKYFISNYHTDLEKVVNWTEAVNKEITARLNPIAPFPHASAAIKEMSLIADLIVVSQTPLEALEREWIHHDLKQYVNTIAGQEHGTKSEHINLAVKSKYSGNRVLMIGDAKGDLDAARNNGILFYPVIPGKEDASWEQFINEGLDRFITGKFKGDYEESLLNEFMRSLPDSPNWKRI